MMSDSSTKLDDMSTNPLEDGDGIASVGDYYSLLKPGVMRLSIFTALVGLIAAPGAIDPIIAIAAVLAIAVGVERHPEHVGARRLVVLLQAGHDQVVRIPIVEHGADVEAGVVVHDAHVCAPRCRGICVHAHT